MNFGAKQLSGLVRSPIASSIRSTHSLFIRNKSIHPRLQRSLSIVTPLNQYGHKSPQSLQCRVSLHHTIKTTNKISLSTIRQCSGTVPPPVATEVVDSTKCHPDGLPRYPNFTTPNGVLRFLDLMGTASFAASGTLLAGHAGMDALGCTVVGTITATGGGTVRDILLGNCPVFWMVETEYLWLILASVAVTFFLFDEKKLPPALKEDGLVFYLTDTVGLGAFAVIGAQNGIRAGMPALICVVCGMITATFGGLIRDVLCTRPVRILHSHAEIYAVTALTGASLYVALRHLGASPTVRIVAGVLSAVCMRHWATTDHVTLPMASWYSTADKKVVVAIEAAEAAKGTMACCCSDESSAAASK